MLVAASSCRAASSRRVDDFNYNNFHKYEITT
jgi:hypothetical protein